MAKAKPIIDNLTADEVREKIYSIAEKCNYRSRTDIQVQYINHRNPEKWPVLDACDFDFIVNKLIPRHGSAAIKIGPGIEKVVFAVNSRCARQARPPCCMYVKRIDGTVTDVSWRECIRPNSHRDKVLCAMRNAVKDQMYQFRDSINLFWTCEICKTVSSNQEFEIDHYPKSFLEIANQWLQSHQLDFSDIEANGVDDFQIGDFFIDKSLESKWSEYHREMIQDGLRPLCRKCHKTRKRKVDAE